MCSVREAGRINDMTHIAAPCTRLATVATLLATGGLHVAWGRGSTFPFTTSAALTDNVVGASRVPSRRACYTVAAGLGGAAVLVSIPDRGLTHRRLVGSLAVLFAIRAFFGFGGRTDLLVAGSTSTAFRRNDRWVFSPVCIGLALGFAVGSRRRPVR